MWNESGWGPMLYGGWWFMPLFGNMFMLICVFIISRFFGAGGHMCGKNNNQQRDMHDIFAELRWEIHGLIMEIKDLRNQNRTNDEKKEDSWKKQW